ncbi:hypothetical protein STEG23_006995 [Scotinomys teguina]
MYNLKRKRVPEPRFVLKKQIKFVYMVYYIDRLSYVKLSLNLWDKAYLTTVENVYDELLDSASILLSIFASMFMREIDSNLRILCDIDINYIMSSKGLHVKIARGRGGFAGQVRGPGRDPGRRRAGTTRPALTKEQLDDELDAYMSKTIARLDADLDAYMAQAETETIY